jgi:hypothetical protein
MEAASKDFEPFPLTSRNVVSPLGTFIQSGGNAIRKVVDQLAGVAPSGNVAKFIADQAKGPGLNRLLSLYRQIRTGEQPTVLDWQPGSVGDIIDVMQKAPVGTFEKNFRTKVNSDPYLSSLNKWMVGALDATALAAVGGGGSVALDAFVSTHAKTIATWLLGTMVAGYGSWSLKNSISKAGSIVSDTNAKLTTAIEALAKATGVKTDTSNGKASADSGLPEPETQYQNLFSEEGTDTEVKTESPGTIDTLSTPGWQTTTPEEEAAYVKTIMPRPSASVDVPTVPLNWWEDPQVVETLQAIFGGGASGAARGYFGGNAEVIVPDSLEGRGAGGGGSAAPKDAAQPSVPGYCRAIIDKALKSDGGYTTIPPECQPLMDWAQTQTQNKEGGAYGTRSVRASTQPLRKSARSPRRRGEGAVE